jgi:NAD(P)-dependent dehydrogenase (short-subunit alcohol dehydrogenase family)
MSDERRIFITGAASGIGRATALTLAAPDAVLVLATRANRAALERVAGDCRGRGAIVHVLVGDLVQPAVVKVLAERALEHLGGLDAFIAVAGRALRKPLADVTAEELRAHLALSAESFLALAQPLIPTLKASRSGRIVAVSSFNAHVFRIDAPPFGASGAGRAALEVLIRQLAIELAPSGVTVNAVAPGFTRKDPGSHSALTAEQWAEIIRRIPLGRVGDPEEVAAVIAFLASPAASYVTGQIIHASGGLVA